MLDVGAGAAPPLVVGELAKAAVVVVGRCVVYEGGAEWWW